MIEQVRRKFQLANPVAGLVFGALEVGGLAPLVGSDSASSVSSEGLDSFSEGPEGQTSAGLSDTSTGDAAGDGAGVGDDVSTFGPDGPAAGPAAARPAPARAVPAQRSPLPKAPAGPAMLASRPT